MREVLARLVYSWEDRILSFDLASQSVRDRAYKRADAILALATPTPPTLSEDLRVMREALEQIADNDCNSWADARDTARSALARAQVKAS